MVDDPNEIVLPILRDIRNDMARMSNSMATMTAEMTAMRKNMGAVVTLQDHDHIQIADLQLRLERVEKRLDLTDA